MKALIHSVEFEGFVASNIRGLSNQICVGVEIIKICGWLMNALLCPGENNVERSASNFQALMLRGGQVEGIDDGESPASGGKLLRLRIMGASGNVGIWRYRGTSLTRNSPLLGPYSRAIPRVL